MYLKVKDLYQGWAAKTSQDKAVLLACLSGCHLLMLSGWCVYVTTDARGGSGQNLVFPLASVD